MFLKGILKCQPCNAAITPSYTTKKNQQRYHYYVCSHHLRGVGCPRPATYMPSHEVDEFIAKHVRTLLKAPQVSAATWLALEKKGISQEKAFEALQDIGHVWDQLHPLERNKIVQIFTFQFFNFSFTVVGNDVGIRIMDLKIFCSRLISKR